MCTPAATYYYYLRILPSSRTGGQAGQPTPDGCSGFHPNGLSEKWRGGVREASVHPGHLGWQIWNMAAFGPGREGNWGGDL